MATLVITEGGTSQHAGDKCINKNNYFKPSFITSLSSVGEIVELLFSNKTVLEWDEFKNAVAYHLRSVDEDLEIIKSLLGAENGTVYATHFAKLLKWFSPLVPEAALKSSSGTGSGSFVWRISSIAALVRQPWFHGFAPDVNKRLRAATAGTYLIRFGCQAPHFILSMKDKNVETVVEWRVVYRSGSFMLVDDERFSNLQTLVENYSTKVPLGAGCYLEVPCDRSNVYR